ncbi:hypothetical protein M430DRAFT_157044 [Amorphotheca resinae ATCC 22711]|uniref:Zn(2)-C6 fungal-type domain-containing protein n=1 Tax=Amorphotheca resinae ATCC 22711 TaxID=857342 RepID=A0A2T3BE40_AMORE|nr:hypothetical protein M430DRAFT_157044 [Amorphotheca resinae ATCC 22711]PSS27677.1 hypothetical protein M430DRAFT_157044 [Amorphotheca resinae ATCC 22711]
MSTKKHSSGGRTEKLRASCDTCYLAKVKCSKSRPLCKRCLVLGTNCTYSPSARLGRIPRTIEKGGFKEEHIITARVQVQREGHFETNSPTMNTTLFNYDDDNKSSQGFEAGDACSTLLFQPLPEYSTPENLLYPEPVPIIMDGNATSGPCIENDDDFGLFSNWLWRTNPNITTANIPPAFLDNYLFQPSPEITDFCAHNPSDVSPDREINSFPCEASGMVDLFPPGIGTATLPCRSSCDCLNGLCVDDSRNHLQNF